MWKPLAKSALAGLVHRLPRAVRRALLQALCEDAAPGNAYELVQALGRRCGITDIRVLGDYGLIEGALADTAVLATYARTRRWAAGHNRIIEFFFAAQDGGTYIDIGANIGLTTIPIARHVGVACKAFEPEPENFRHLTRNLRHNCNAGNVEAFNLALFDRHGTIAFELADDNLGDHRIHLADDDGSFGEARRRVITVPTERLDDVLNVANLAQPVVVKIDTQGAECQVLEGGRTVLDASALVAFEFWPYGMARMASDAEALIRFVTTRFSAGAVLAGDVDEPPVWRPIAMIAARLREYCRRDRGNAYAYCDVMVRK